MSVLLGQTVSASWAKHLSEREVRRAEQNRLVEQALVITDEIENNCRAALGLQLKCVRCESKCVGREREGAARKCACANKDLSGARCSI
jgi:hypothetical protein